MNRAEFEYKLFNNLTITEDNLVIFRQLLRLPYPEFKVLIEMLLNTQLTPEDFMDSSGIIKDVNVETARDIINTKSETYEASEIISVLKAKNASGKNTNTKLGYTFDHKSNIVDSLNFDKLLPYLVDGRYVVSDGNFDSIVPNSIQIKKAGSTGQAKKEIQKQLVKRRLNK